MRQICSGCLLAAALAAPVSAELIMFSDPSGLAGEAELTLLGLGDEIEIRLRNTSTGVPGDFEAADQLLTSLSFDLGAPGDVAGDPSITGGSAITGPNSSSVNFSVMNVGPGEDIGGEWGFGNGGATGLLGNFITGNTSGASAFGGMNLDGPAGLNGPQAGLLASEFVPLGGIGAIQDEIIVTISLDQAIADLSFLDNGAIIEFGSDAAFVSVVPAPGALAVLGAGLLTRRRRRHAFGMRDATATLR